jgi:autophagy-related protein 16
MSIDFAQNDEYVLASSTDNAARMWSLSLGRVQHNLMGHRAEVVTSKFTFDTLKVFFSFVIALDSPPLS